MTGEQSAQIAGDSARDAEKNGTTGLLVESSNDLAAESTSRPVSIIKDPVENKSGSKLYYFHCASCHGEKGTLGKIKLTNGTLDEIEAIISEGKPELGMPAWKNVLSNSERKAVAQFVFDFRKTSQTP